MRLRASVREALARHGVAIEASDTPAALKERLNDLYLDEVRRLKARQQAGEIPSRDYAAHAQATIEPFGGCYLVRGGRSIGIEGEPPKPRIVISVFDSFAQAQAWRNSPEYMEIAAVREREAKSRQYIVEGLPE